MSERYKAPAPYKADPCKDPYKAPAASEEKLRGRSEMLRFMAAIQFNLR